MVPVTGLSLLHKPAAETAGMLFTGALEKEMFFLSADDDRIAVQQAAGGGGAEGADILDPENTPVRPGDEPGLHIAGLVKIGGYFYVNTIRQETYTPKQFIMRKAQ